MMVSADKIRNLMLHLLSNMLNLPIQLTYWKLVVLIVTCRVHRIQSPAAAELKKQVSTEMEQQSGILDNTLGLGVRRLCFYSCYMTVTKLLPVSLTTFHPHPSSASTASLLS